VRPGPDAAFALALPAANTAAMPLCLDRFAATPAADGPVVLVLDRAGWPVVLVLDRAGWPVAQGLRGPPNLSLILSAKSPGCLAAHVAAENWPGAVTRKRTGPAKYS